MGRFVPNVPDPKNGQWKNGRFHSGILCHSSVFHISEVPKCSWRSMPSISIFTPRIFITRSVIHHKGFTSKMAVEYSRGSEKTRFIHLRGNGGIFPKWSRQSLRHRRIVCESSRFTFENSLLFFFELVFFSSSYEQPEKQIPHFRHSRCYGNHSQSLVRL